MASKPTTPKVEKQEEQDKPLTTEQKLEKLAAMENALEELTKKPIMIATIDAGPYLEMGITKYRLNMDGKPMIGIAMPDFNGGNPVEVGKEVGVTEGAVVYLVPSPLYVAQEAPHFELIEWSSIGGLKSQLEDIRMAVEFPMKNKKIMEDYGIKPTKGILLYGPPGCGKTLIAKAIASVMLKDANLNQDAFIYAKGGEMLESLVGAAEKKIKHIFERAREYYKKEGKAAVIFVDEAEAILKKRGSGISSDATDSIVASFLAEMDGFEKGGPLVILATNHKDSLDSAVTRQGRIDLPVEVARPNATDCVDIFEIHLKPVLCHDDKRELAVEAAIEIGGFKHRSGALIEGIVREAATTSLRRFVRDQKSPKGIIMDDMKIAIEKILSTYATAKTTEDLRANA